MIRGLKKLNDKTAVIGIVGLGYVGLPLAIRYADVGYKVIGFDNDARKPKDIASGKTYIKHIPSADIQQAVEKALRRQLTLKELWSMRRFYVSQRH